MAKAPAETVEEVPEPENAVAEEPAAPQPEMEAEAKAVEPPASGASEAPAADVDNAEGQVPEPSSNAAQTAKVPSLGVTALQCQRCGSYNVKRSRRHGAGEWISSLVGYRYYRCHNCLNRFSRRGN